MKLKHKGRQLLLHGMILVLVGLVWGFFVPATPYPRLALTAHIQLTGNGVLFMALSIAVLTLPNRVGSKSLVVMLIAAWLTWVMALSQIANAWWGTNQMLPIAAAQAGATGGEPWQELIVRLTHIGAGFGLLAAWVLLIVGFVKVPDAEADA
jgi:(hydroxyamino)benzene mutase